MTETILKLYDTFLARFAFFRRHIQVLMELYNKVKTLDKEVEDLIKMVELLNEDNKDLRDKCEELEKALTKAPTKNETSRDLTRTSQDIMQSIYSNYYATGEALPDRK
jgi:regulator of replication initiation timing